MKIKPLPRTFFSRKTDQVARELLGKYIVRKIDHRVLIGKIVETEAYTGDDPASHAFIGKTPRTRALFETPGHAYIYFIYGNHYCLNIVAHSKEHAGGVLIRALEPISGIEYMKKCRHVTDERQLTNGPGKLTQALHITKNLYGQDMTKKEDLFVGEIIPKEKTEFVSIVATPRIGISKARDILWRFIIEGNPWLSRKK